MIETISRHDRRTEGTRDRLALLMGQARANPREEMTELAPDQQWEDVSADPPDPPPREPWWRRGMTGRLVAEWVPEMSADARRRLTMALACGVVLAVLTTVGVAIMSGGVEHETPSVLPVAVASETSAAAEPSIVVSVVGQVANPGLVTLPEGARVADAVREAGGPAPGLDLTTLNMARRLADGEQIYVGIPVPAGAEPAPAVSGAPGPGEKVDLNTATLAALDTLPGVGPVTAQRIVDWRTEHGRFDSVDQLREIDGIGPTKFAKLHDLVVAR